MRFLRLVFLAAPLLALAAFAAPAPVEPGEDDSWLRAMPENADTILLLDVKQFMGSPLVKKELKGKLPSILSNKFLVPVPLKPLGVDPTRDLTQWIAVMNRDMWMNKAGEPAPRGGGILVLARTTKSVASLRGKLAELARDAATGVKELPGGKIWSYSTGGPKAVVAVLPGGILALSENARPIEAALARLKTGKRPAFKDADIAKFMKPLRRPPFLRLIMLPDAVVSSQTERRIGAGGAPPMLKTKLVTLAENGFAGVRLSATVAQTIKGKCDLLCNDAATATRKAKELEGLRGLILPMLEEKAKTVPSLAACLRSVKTAKITAVGKVLHVEAEMGPEAVTALELFEPR